MSARVPTGASPRDYIRGYETMTPRQIVAIVEDRVVVERVKGLLMFIYDIDDETAFEMLRSSARASRTKLGPFADRLMDGLKALTPAQRWNLRPACDELLRTGAPANDPSGCAMTGEARAACYASEHPKLSRSTPMNEIVQRNRVSVVPALDAQARLKQTSPASTRTGANRRST